MKPLRALLAASLGIAAATALTSSPAAASGTYTPLYTFTGGDDGAGPNQLIQDAAGNFYGTTAVGNITTSSCVNNQTGACGTVFKLTPSGQLTTFADFTGPDGASPYGPLTLIGNTLYGSTVDGGASSDGVIFSVNTDGTDFKLLYQFTGSGGAHPVGALLPVSGGGLYGVVSGGQGNLYYGGLFQRNKGGTLVYLHAFNEKAGYEPNSLFYGPGGTLIGATYLGGKGCVSRSGCGTIFSYDPKAKSFSLLYQFTDRKDGEVPTISAVDAAGDIYGATNSGAKNNAGTTFELVANGNGTYTMDTLFAFGATSIGNFDTAGPVPLPTGQLIEQSNNTLFLFDPKLPQDGTILQTIPTAEFDSAPILGGNGTVYGSASSGGTDNYGLIYSYTRPGAP